MRDLLDRFNAISAGFAEPDADFDKLVAEQAEARRTRSTPPTRWELDRSSRSRWTRCGCRRATPT